MELLVYLGYGLTALSSLGLLALLVPSGWPNRVNLWFLVAVAITACWSLAIVSMYWTGKQTLPGLLSLDALRAFAWLFFVTRLFGTGLRRSRWWMLCAGTLCLAVILVWGFFAAYLEPSARPADAGIALVAIALLNLFGLEQVFRNSTTSQRWALKPLFLAVGAFSTYDLYVFSNLALLGSLDFELWSARGLVAALCSPILVLAAKRRKGWAHELFISREMVLYTATLVGVGVYLVAMAAVGYVVRTQSAEWGRTWQIVFFVAALLLLAAILFSAQLRARARIFISKHFYRNRYDYREEWLRLIDTLSDRRNDELAIGDCATKALADIVGSESGVLWTKVNGHFQVRAAWNRPKPETTFGPDHSLIDFLARTKWVVDTQEYSRDPDLYQNSLPTLDREFSQSTLIVPLTTDSDLYGFVAMPRPSAVGELNYEDHDLLKTAGRQVAALLSREDARDELQQSKQFEAVNKLVTFLMHDLKNVAAQQELLLGNAVHHRDNPRFVDDMISTVENSASRIRRLLEQLERGREVTKPEKIGVGRLFDRVVNICDDRAPVPTIRVSTDLTIYADVDRLEAGLVHAVRNSQDATSSDGAILLTAEEEDGEVRIDVTDNGSGMAPDFVRERLFRPFDTTKGSRGMGIGAFQLKEVVTEAGGRLYVESETGRGTKLTLFFPSISGLIENPNQG